MIILINLIAVLVALVVQRYGNIAGWFKISWFEMYLTWLRPFIVKANNRWLGFGVVVLPILIVMALLNIILMQGFFGLFYLIFSSLVLLLFMDARDIKHKLENYFILAEKKDVEGAIEAIHSNELVNDGAELPKTLPELSRCVTKVIFAKNYTNVFGILFWFSVCNIYGAVIYAILSLLRRCATNVDGSFKDLAELAILLQSILDWIPTRILNLIYALVGNFSQGFTFFKKHVHTSIVSNIKIVVDSGLASLGVDLDQDAGTWAESKLAIELIDRVLIVWIVVLSLVTFGMLV